MANHAKVARPYARALFALALQQHQLTLWQQALTALALVAKDPSLKTVLSNPKLSAETLAQMIWDVVQQVSPDLSAIKEPLQNVIQLLCQTRRVAVLPDIARWYDEMLAEQNRIVNAEVVSAQPLSEQSRQRIAQALEKRFASQTSIHYQQDPSLIGGILVRVGDWVLDGTLKTRLARLKEVIAL